VIVWAQYAVLRTGLPPAAKSGIVFVGGSAFCWAATAALRQIRVVGRFI